MKLAVAVITTPSREASLPKEKGLDLFVYEDTDFKGVAWNRNRAMADLYKKGYDYIAICDDDLIYLHNDWMVKSCEVMADPNWGATYACLPDTIKGFRAGSVGPYFEHWDSYIGALYILNRHVLDEVGYFSSVFKGYGFEDVHYKHRLRQYYGYVRNPKILPYMVASMDVLGHNPTPSRTDKEEQMRINEPIFKAEIENGQIYYPFTSDE